jgi:hypothetical protein
MERHEGTPQGGPLSPLLANVLLDDVDKELERRGHAFVRYADDSNVYVRPERAGQRVMRALRRLFAELRLRVNEANYLTGWKEYFRLTEMPTALRKLDEWIRRRLRMVQLKQWKTGPRVFRELCARGVPRNAAASAAAHAQRWWRTARHPALNLALPPREFDRLGLPRLAT